MVEIPVLPKPNKKAKQIFMKLTSDVKVHMERLRSQNFKENFRKKE